MENWADRTSQRPERSGGITLRITLGLLGLFLTLPTTRLGNAGLSGRRRGHGCVILGAELGRRTAAGVILGAELGRGRWDGRNGAQQENGGFGGATRMFPRGRIGQNGGAQMFRAEISIKQGGRHEN